MALAVTLATLRTEVRRRTDQVDSTQVSDAEINGWINRGMRHYVRLLVKDHPDFYVSTSSLNTTSGTYEYTLPSGFLSIRGVDRVDGDNRTALHGFTWANRNRYQGHNTKYPRYRVLYGGRDGSGVRLQFASDPGTTTAGYLVYYVGVPADLSADGDELDDVLGLTDYVVVYAAALLRESLDEDSSGLRMELGQMETAVTQLARQRSADGTVRWGNSTREIDEVPEWQT